MPLYSSLVRHQLQDECSWKYVQGSRGIPETFAEKWRMQLFVLQRENKMNTSDTFTKPTTFLTGSGLIQMMHIKCTSVPVT